MTIIGLKEFTLNADEIAERIKNGEQFTVVKRSKPLFVASAPDSTNTDLKTWLDGYIQDNRDLLISLADK
jgi:hypothetical protein